MFLGIKGNLERPNDNHRLPSCCLETQFDLCFNFILASHLWEHTLLLHWIDVRQNWLSARYYRDHASMTNLRDLP